MLNQLRLETSSMSTGTESESLGAGIEGPGDGTAPESWQTERTKLKVIGMSLFLFFQDFLERKNFITYSRNTRRCDLSFLYMLRSLCLIFCYSYQICIIVSN